MERPQARTIAIVTAFTILVVSGFYVWRAARQQNNHFAQITPFNPSTLDSRLSFGSTDVEGLELFIFLNFNETASRQAFSKLERLSSLDYPYTVHILHLPGAYCSPSNAPSACNAPVAVECAETVRPGVGLSYAHQVFALQWANKMPSVAELVDLAKEHGFDPALFRKCVTRDNQEVTARIDKHQSQAAQAGLLEAPAVWMRWTTKDGERAAFLGRHFEPTTIRAASRCLVERACGEAT